MGDMNMPRKRRRGKKIKFKGGRRMADKKKKEPEPQPTAVKPIQPTSTKKEDKPTPQ